MHKKNIHKKTQPQKVSKNKLRPTVLLNSRNHTQTQPKITTQPNILASDQLNRGDGSLSPTLPQTEIAELLSLYNQHRFADCEALAHSILKTSPDHGFTWKVLGATFKQQERLDEAMMAMKQAVTLLPSDPEALNNLGLTLQNKGLLKESESTLRRALEIKSDFAEAYNNLGITLMSQRRLAEAEECLRKALKLKPEYDEAYSNLGINLQDQWRLTESTKSFQQALRLNPSSANALNNLGNVLNVQGMTTEAEKYLRKALVLKPDFAVAYANLGNILNCQGRIDESEQCYLKALEIKPDYIQAYQDFLFISNYHPDKSSEEIFLQYKEYDNRFGIPHQNQWSPHTNPDASARRLKVGYVSPSFYRHPVSYFLVPLLECHDKTRFEVFAYADIWREDEMTTRYKKHIEHWIPSISLSDDELAKRIRNDGIDILVDLAGPTIWNRMGVFARKPAPVSLHWLDFGYTTGFSSIDYYLADITNAPLGSENLFSEKLWRVPAPAFAYRPPVEEMGDVSPLPAAKNGSITFGTLTRAIRINHRTIRVWSAILNRVQDSRLVIDSSNFKDASVQKLLIDKFAAQGIDKKRLEIGYHSPPWDVLRSIDICFDCFPHNSGTTLIESLYMGVPFITLADRPSVGRLGSTILEGAGHSELIARSEEEYIELATTLAGDLERLTTLRTNLRHDMERSPLMDEPGFAKKIEAAFSDMFTLWNKSNNPLTLQDASINQPDDQDSSVTQNINFHQINTSLHIREQKDAPETIQEKATGPAHLYLAKPTQDEIQKLEELFNKGKHEEALRIAKSITFRFPQHGFGWKVLGPLLYRQGNTDKAILAMKQAILCQPEDPEAQYNLGIAYEQSGRLEEAADTYREVLLLNQNHTTALFNLGNIAGKNGQLAEAEKLFRRALQLQPDYFEVYCNLGNILRTQGRLDEAINSYHSALKIKPDSAGTLSNLSLTLQYKGKLDEAEIICKKAIQLQPELAEANNNLGIIYQGQGRFSEAESWYKKAIELKNDYSVALVNLGALQLKQFRFAEAADNYIQASKFEPQNIPFHSYILFLLNYHPDLSGKEIFERYKKFNSQFTQPLQREQKPFSNSLEIQRTLKIGYVSPAFSKHAIRHFLEPLLAHHDKTHLEIFAYADIGTEDKLTDKYKSYVNQWVDSTILNDAELAERIRNDGIDILIDLAGHTKGNRLGVFARKPAPVSLHWLDFGYTTGLTAIDYYLADHVTFPEGSEELFSEAPWRIPPPGVVYRPEEDMGEVSPLPALDRGYITFGTLTRSIRINHRTIRVWAKILQRVPGSHLVIDSSDFQNQITKESLEEKFISYGIEKERLEIDYHSPPWDILRNMDIGFDCFPHNSGTTLFETLYMGVPFVTLINRPSVGRLGGAILTGLGHPEWIAYSEDDYADLAVSLSSDLSRLAILRKTLRQEMEKSPLMDEPAFARQMEKAYGEMFQKWVKKNTATINSSQKDVDLSQQIALIIAQADTYRKSGHLKDAEDLYISVLQISPNNPEVNFNLGLLEITRQRPAIALSYFEAAIDARPEHGPYWLAYIDALDRSGQPESAFHVMEMAIRAGLDGKDTEALKSRLTRKQSKSPSLLSIPATESVVLPSSLQKEWEQSVPPSEPVGIYTLISAKNHTKQIKVNQNPPPEETNRLISLYQQGNIAEAETLARSLIRSYPHNSHAWKVKGAIFRQQGKLEDALSAMEMTVKLCPGDYICLRNLAIILIDLGRLTEAEEICRKALSIHHDYADAFDTLGVIFRAEKNFPEAESSFRKALELKPDSTTAMINLSLVLNDQEMFSEAELSCRKALELTPDSAEAYCSLGIILRNLEQPKEAVEACQHALAIKPIYAAAANTLGSIYNEQENYPDAEFQFRRALEADNFFVEALHNLGISLYNQYQYVEAETCLLRVLALEPTHADAYYNLGNALFRQGKNDEAESNYQAALKIKADHFNAICNLGNSIYRQGRLSEAKTIYQKALQIDPSSATTVNNLAMTYQEQGNFSMSENMFRSLLDSKPDYARAFSNLLFLLNYHPDRSAKEIFQEYTKFEERIGKPLRSQWKTHTNKTERNRRLKIGYVSPEFRKHPIHNFLKPLFTYHNSDEMELYAYAETHNAEDKITEWYKAHTDHWIQTQGMTDKDIAERIRSDGIDILVDLAGHTGDNRLPVFAYKPAPVSLHWLDFGYTTGLKAIDYYLTDSASVPQESEGLFSERPWRIATPCFVYRPVSGMGEVNALPATSRGHITFGCLSRAVRINHRVIQAWANILKQVRGARLVINSGSYRDPEMKQLLIEKFAAHGIDRNSLEIGFNSPPWDVLRSIDIGLDCFPHNSGTTLIESLYMGIPFVTLADRPSVGRLGSSILEGIGHREWIAKSEDEYCDLAVRLATDLAELSEIRSRLRHDMERSPLMDEPAFARKMEAAYKEMFAKWCEEQQ